MRKYQKDEEVPLNGCMACGWFGEDERGNYCKADCSPVGGVVYLGGPKFIKFMVRVIEDIDVNMQKPDWCPMSKVTKE